MTLSPLPTPMLQDDPAEGLAQDLAAMQRLVARRRALGLIGLGAGAMVAGCSSAGGSTGTSGTVTTATPTPGATPTPTPTATSTATGSCTAYATETNGPYPADGTNVSSGSTSNVLTASGIVRSDIRSSFLNGSTTIAAGVPLTLSIQLANVNNSCAPLSGYAIYVWHCNAAGQYSLYSVPAESWLRGLQVTDANGMVTFTTIWPGCYSGRFPHIHFEVFTTQATALGGGYARLISQFAMPDTQNRLVYASSGYGSSTSNYANISIASDNVFGDNSAAQITAMTMSATGSVASGFTASAIVGIAV